jgi:hypothetical protein
MNTIRRLAILLAATLGPVLYIVVEIAGIKTP